MTCRVADLEVNVANMECRFGVVCIRHKADPAGNIPVIGSSRTGN